MIQNFGFRFRELSGMEDCYFHGSLTTGSRDINPRGRKFRNNEFEWRKKIHASLKDAQYEIVTPKKDE